VRRTKFFDRELEKPSGFELLRVGDLKHKKPSGFDY